MIFSVNVVKRVSGVIFLGTSKSFIVSKASPPVLNNSKLIISPSLTCKGLMLNLAASIGYLSFGLVGESSS
ncbi:hypothetical protein fh0823_03290 [Francisella halioticida]|uniref:hypothetical protein n=1 Tax=Francisella halioticida TaxID=549298 RepID=UPI0012FC8316|nr:hypothetical protein [Francisella halioticida]BCD90190.1 hypothetical protein fh0823_03290 [Francisella halioticida]